MNNYVLGYDNSGVFMYKNVNKYPEGTEPDKIYINVVLQGKEYSIIEIDEEYINGMVSYIND